MRHFIAGLTLLLCQGCTTLNVGLLNADSSSGVYNPVTADNVNAEQYKADKQQCFKQVQSENSDSMADHYNVVKFRECLVKKGYVLLS
jgi:hypothetical protein